MMEGNPTCCSPASMVVLVVLVSFPVKSWCKDPREASENAILKRSHGMDMDSFVGLMGKRGTDSAGSHIDFVLAGLLREKPIAMNRFNPFFVCDRRFSLRTKKSAEEWMQVYYLRKAEDPTLSVTKTSHILVRGTNYKTWNVAT